MTETLLARIPAIELFPVIENGTLAAKATEGEPFPIRATVFREGHDAFAAEAVLIDPDGMDYSRTYMVDIAPGLDRMEAWVMANRPGRWSFRVDSWSDPYATWCHDATIKVGAGVDTDLMLEEGARLLERAIAGNAQANPLQQPLTGEEAATLKQAAQALRDTSRSPQQRLSAGLSSSVRTVFKAFPLRDLIGSTPSYPLEVARERALSGSWYEIFPRSAGAFQNPDGTWVSGTLEGARHDLDRIADMGFNVVYLTPIHPIGTTNRKGRNNTLIATAEDPGSPYGIGSAEGGHEAIHPDLGSFADFDAFVARARELTMEVALDLALQCSPDHPWVHEHPEWFTARADGSIAYAENPPKKYQDIYPLNFDNDPEGIYTAIRDVITLWIEHGVTIFRVDNPHTKPVNFWQRIIAEIKEEHPDVIFLAEAFTRPAMMRTLGSVGFDQSYTYFTWRTHKEEIEDYLLEVSTQTSHLMRPTFWPTTHDILTAQMTTGGTAIFAIRAMLAALGSPNWGIYSGYEFVENVQRPGFEEQNDNEKYEYRPRHWADADNIGISHLLRLLNRARDAHPALRQLHQIDIHPTDNPNLICFSRRMGAAFTPNHESDTVINIISLDPHHPVEGWIRIDPEKLGIENQQGQFTVVDELDGTTYTWNAHQWVSLSPYTRLGHVLAVQPPQRSWDV